MIANVKIQYKNNAITELSINQDNKIKFQLNINPSGYAYCEFINDISNGMILKQLIIENENIESIKLVSNNINILDGYNVLNHFYQVYTDNDSALEKIHITLI